MHVKILAVGSMWVHGGGVKTGTINEIMRCRASKTTAYPLPTPRRARESGLHKSTKGSKIGGMIERKTTH